MPDFNTFLPLLSAKTSVARSDLVHIRSGNSDYKTTFEDLQESMDLNLLGAVPEGRRVNTTAPLIGGGDLDGNLTLNINNATTGARGVVELATSAETLAGNDNTRAITPQGLAAYVGGAAAPNATTATRGLVELATNAETGAKSDGSKAVTPNSLNGLNASTSTRGLIEIATDSEANSGTDTVRAINAKQLKTAREQATTNALNSIPATSTTRRGLVELATTTEASAGTDNSRAITPAVLSHIFNTRTATSSRRGSVELATLDEARAGTGGSLAITAAVLDGMFSGKAETPSGHMRLPNNWYIQWGLHGMSGGSNTQYIAFDVPFPTKVLNIQLTNREDANHEGNIGRVFSYNKNGFTLSNRGGNTHTSWFWFAIGR